MGGAGEIITLEETAKRLKVGKSTLNEISREGKIPAVKIEIGKNNRVIIRVPDSQELTEKAKKIPGRRWGEERRYRKAPYSENLIAKLQIPFGRDLIVDECRKAAIKKRVCVHSLRNSFATPLLESGIDLRYIEGPLGHKISKTAEIYTYVSTKNLSAMRNPLDSFLKGGET